MCGLAGFITFDRPERGTLVTYRQLDGGHLEAPRPG